MNLHKHSKIKVAMNVQAVLRKSRDYTTVNQQLAEFSRR